ncbi:class I adenylate-forming enzyme family protein [Chloroflexota bacterium]
MDLRMMLEGVAARYGEKAAIIVGENRLSYSDFDIESNRIANTLKGLGVKKDDRVAMMLPNSPEFAVVYFGAVKIGAITIPLDTKYKPDELTSLFDDCLPKILVAESDTLETLKSSLSKFKSIEHIIEVGDEFSGESLSYSDITASGPEQPLKVELSSEDIAQIGYTSGPSFGPRGVMLSHRSLLEEAKMSAEGYRQTNKDIMMLYALPMYHVYGMVASFLASIYSGSTVVIVPGTGLSIGSFMAAIEREKGTMFLGVPFIFSLAVDLAEKEGIKYDLSSLRLCASAGAPLSVDIKERFKKLYGFDIWDCWGLTEAVCHLTCPTVNGKMEVASVGKALSGWELKIVDNDGKELPVNQSGEIIVRGPIMKGYYNNPQATAEVIKDGWLYTGDVGRFDEKDNLYITGRKKDTIIVKGQNINPGDIESILLKHPAVAEAVVLGIPDKLRGEVVGAIVSLKEGQTTTEQELRQLCLEQLISYKAPKKILFTDSMPKTVEGMIDKEKLRDNLSIPPVFQES